VPLPEDPRGRELAKLILRDQHERWVVSEIDNILTATFREVVSIIVSPGFATMKAGQKARLLTLFARVTAKLSGGYGDINSFMYDTSLELGSIESKIAAQELAAIVADSDVIRLSTVSALDDTKLNVIARFPIEGLPLGDWWKKQAADMSIATRRAIQIGLINGETPAQLAKRIVPVGEEPGVLRQARVSARMLTRTTFTMVQNQAAVETYQKAGRGKVSDSYKYVAVRDARTSSICRALDGKIFRYDDPRAKLPPQHPNCRSTVIPVVNYQALGLDATSESMFNWGSYDKWLKAQSPDMVRQLLGVNGATLYNSGKASLADLVNEDGRRLSTKQLVSAFGVL
jgi:SPP1 gp7 family putative phage head morphogenesis protein